MEARFLVDYEQRTEKVDSHIEKASVQSASNELLILLDTLAKRFNTKVNFYVSEGIESVHACLESRGLSQACLLSHLAIL